MSVVLPPNSTGSTVATLTSGAKEYQECILSDGVTPTQLNSVLLPENPESLEIAQLRVASHPLDGSKATYSAAYTAGSLGTSATTAVFQIGGSASKTVRVTDVIISATIATAGEEYDLTLQFETVLPTGGTSATAATKVPWDSNDAAATAVTKFWTAAPTDGTVTGVMWVEKFSAFIATATTVQPPNYVKRFSFGSLPGSKAVVLRGVAQGLVFTLNGATPAHASSWDVTFIWTEE